MSRISKKIRLNKELVEQIEKLAKEQNRSFTNMVETILLDYAENPLIMIKKPIG